MISENKKELKVAVSKMKSFCNKLDRELGEQINADSRLPNAPNGDKNEELAKIDVGGYFHIDSEIRRIYTAAQATTYLEYGE